ncbi:hypothetical protein NMY22_g19065 [Coprinellus aureogranulatus]|nr:hypothetical protein NMY22_g19065 [Coprinellus aureogranulatus]
MATYNVVAATTPGQLGVVQATVPEPVDDQAVIKVVCSTLGPFDLTNLDRQFFVFGYPYVFGLSAAGTVDKVGPKVTDLKVGDRVAALTLPPGSKGLQPYTIQSRSVVAKIPDSLSFEEAVTLPDNFVTAYFTLFNQLGLPTPSEWPAKSNPNKDHPVLIYGAGASSGQYTIQVLKFAGYTNIITAASKLHEEYLKSLGATHVIDYRSPSFVEDVKQAAGGLIEHVMDCISLPSTFALIKEIIKPGGKLAHLVPFKAGSGLKMFLYQEDERLAKTLVPKTLPRFIELGLQPNRVRRVEHADPSPNCTPRKKPSIDSLVVRSQKMMTRV